jgi:hypothetical protein
VDQLGFRDASSSSRGIGALGADGRAFVSVAASGARGGADASRDMFEFRPARERYARGVERSRGIAAFTSASGADACASTDAV